MRIWHTTRTAAEHVAHHPDTIRRACEAGELHGIQRQAGKSHWRIHVDCLNAWAAGEKCEHQAAAA